MNYEICVIGNEALLFTFLQFGFTTFKKKKKKELRDYLQDVIDKNYGIIYIEDSYCFMVSDILEKYRDNLTPVFIPIGENEHGESYYSQTVKDMMEKAIGQNVL
jgi:V/A-type H+-transporting ATPase subunit F